MDTDYVEGFRPEYVVGWDTETHLISDRAGLAPPVVCLTAAGGSGTAEFALWAETHGARVDWEGEQWKLLVDKTSPAIAEIFKEMVYASDVAVAHNLAFDLAIAEQSGWISMSELMNLTAQGVFRDTMVREMLIAIATDNFQYDARLKGQRTSFSLAHLAEVYLGKKRYDEKKNPDSWRLRYGDLDGVPWLQWPEAAVDYAIEDAEDARLVFLCQGQPSAIPEGIIVNADGNVTNERAQTQAAVALHYMAMHSPRVDQRKVNTFAEEVKLQVEQAQKAATQAGCLRVNKCKDCENTGYIGSPPHMYICTTCQADPTYMPKRVRVPRENVQLHKGRLQAWVYAALGEFAPKTAPSNSYPQGQIKTDAATLKMTGQPLLVAYAEGQEAQKDLSTYVPILHAAAKGKLTSRPNVLVRSGRTSWRNPNFQNPTSRPGFRECFVAKPGHVFSSIDYKTVELVTLAQTNLDWFGYSKMADALNAGQDLHLAFACWMLQIPYEDGHARLEAGDAEVKTARKHAKVANFGFPGGLGVKTLVEYAKGFGVNIDLNRAEELRDMWRQAWPEMKEYFDKIGDMAKEGLPDKMGTERFAIRQEPTGRIRGGAHYTSACNTLFQGRAADLAKAAMWDLHHACYVDQTSTLYGVRMWAFVHDEFLFEGPQVTAFLWADEAVRIMEAAGKVFVPDVQLSAIPALCPYWTKAMEPVYDHEGHLIPWEKT